MTNCRDNLIRPIIQIYHPSQLSLKESNNPTV